MRLVSKIYLIILFLSLLGGCAMHQPMSDKKVSRAAASNAPSDAEDAQSLYQLGRSFQDKGNYPEAIRAYEKALALEPDFAEVYNGMGVVYSLQGENKLAVQLIKEAIRLSPMSSHLYNNLGYIHLQHGNAAEAADTFERALSLDPNNMYARRNLAAAYKKLGCVNSQPCGRWQQPIDEK